jgi:hypothetical protein
VVGARAPDHSPTRLRATVTTRARPNPAHIDVIALL